MTHTLSEVSARPFVPLNIFWCTNMTVYLDHNASNLIDERLLAHHIDVLKNCQGNPGSPHQLGRKARARIEEARENLAALLSGFDIGGVTFCSSGTEALNLGLKRSVDWQPGDHIIYSAIEHKAVLETVKFLGQAFGVASTAIPVSSSGVIELDAVSTIVTDRTRLCAVMTANNEVGTIQPLRALKESLPSDILLLSDAVQGAARMDLDDLVADIVVVSSHKMRAPKGAAALLSPENLGLNPLIHGGSQERGRRAGTEDTAAISSLGLAARFAKENSLCDRTVLRGRQERFEAHLKKSIPSIVINGEQAPRLPQTTNVMIPGWTSEKLITALDLYGFHASSGSACTSGSLLPSHVLLAMGLSEDDARSALRLSYGPETTEEELLKAAQTLAKIVRRA
jgi:cysteine desulfurase